LPNRNVLRYSLLFTLLATAGCTTATKNVTNTTQVSQPVISQTIVEEDNRTLKRTVAIARFSDETKRGNSFLLDSNNNRIGKQASDILAARLTDSQKFIMLEHDAIASIKPSYLETDSDNSLVVFSSLDGANKPGLQANSIGAEYIIIGSVSEYGRSTVSDVGVFSRNKIQQAKVTVNVRLVNIKTGEIIYSEEAKGLARAEANNVLGVGRTAAYDSSLDDSALSAAISKLTSNIIENLLDKPWKAYIVSQQNGQFFVTGGAEQGIKVGDTFMVEQPGETVINPQSGLPLELPGQKIATIKVTQLMGSGSNAMSMCEVTSGTIDKNQIKNLVVKENDV
jgi:curli biogenesis system outer membrane secretion channel CsgG